MRNWAGIVMVVVMGAFGAGCGGSPCGAYVEATTKWGGEAEKKMASENKDAFVKACEIGMKGSDEMAQAQKKLVECGAKASDQAAYEACHKGM